MRYGFDTFSFRKQGLIESKVFFNCNNITNVEGFNITGVQPNGCDRRLVFKIDNKWYKLIGTGNGTLQELPTQDINIESVLIEGNTVDELTAITSIPDFLNKSVYTAIALDAPPDAEVMPSIAIELKIRNNQDQFQKEEFSAEYKLADTDVNVVTVTSDNSLTGQANASIMVSLKQSGTWGGWSSPLLIKDQKASDIKFKATYTVTTLNGEDIAKINKVSCIYCNSNARVSGNNADLLTITSNYEVPLSYVRGHIIHKKLVDSQIIMNVSFREKPKVQELLNVGTGTGERLLIQLDDTGINHNTLKLFFDSKPTYEFDYNTELSQLICTAPVGAAITAQYEYGWEKEEWVLMKKVGTQPQQESNNYMTSFVYELPIDQVNKTVSDIKVNLYRPNGIVTDEVLGMGLGKKQLFVLPHYAKKETVKCSGQFSYDDDSRIITTIVPLGTEIKVSYEWIGETPEVSGIVIAWNEL
ncbi:MAG: hypothetical protein RR536_05685 [Anaerovoracaceae bacterium]